MQNAKCKIWAQYLPASGQKNRFRTLWRTSGFDSSFLRHSTVYLSLQFNKKLPEILTFQISLSIFPTAKSLHGCFCTIIHTQTGRTRLRGQGWEGGERQDRVVRSLGKHVCVCTVCVQYMAVQCLVVIWLDAVWMLISNSVLQESKDSSNYFSTAFWE